jgi:hypothetical protein
MVGKPFVNHKNGNPVDNRITNFEWTTHSQNVLRAYQTGLIKPKGKLVYDVKTGKTFRNMRDAATSCRINYYTLRYYLNGSSPNNPTGFRFVSDITSIPAFGTPSL